MRSRPVHPRRRRLALHRPQSVFQWIPNAWHRGRSGGRYLLHRQVRWRFSRGVRVLTVEAVYSLRLRAIALALRGPPAISIQTLSAVTDRRYNFNHMNTFNSQSTLKAGSVEFEYFSLENADKSGAGEVSKLPFSLKVMLENLLRFEDGQTVSADDIRALVSSIAARRLEKEIA